MMDHDHDYDGVRTWDTEGFENDTRINYSCCLICQSENGEKLTVPTVSVRKDGNAG